MNVTSGTSPARGLDRGLGDGGEVDGRTRRERFGVAAGELLEAVEQRRHARVLAAHGLQDLGVAPAGVALQGLDVHAERGERCAQLVPGVGREAARRVHAALEPFEHPVQCRRQLRDLALAADLGQALVAAYVGGAAAQPVQRAQHEAREQPGGERGERGREQRHEADQAGVVAQPLLDRGEALKDLELPAAERLGERAPVLPLDVHGRVAGGHLQGRQRLTARGQDARAVEHAGRRIGGRERIAAGVPWQQLRAVLADVGLHLVGLRAQLPVELDAVLVGAAQRDHEPGERDDERGEQGRAERDLRAQAPHGRNTNPTPRTVCSSRGAPILRRT